MFIPITPESLIDRIEFDSCMKEVRLYYKNGKVTIRRFTKEEFDESIIQIDV